MSRLSQPWQLRALTYYDQIGEIRFASQFYAKLISRVRYYPARQLEDGKTEPITEGLPVELLHRIQDPGGGRSRLQYDYGRMMFVTGEGVLFGDRLETEQERWRFLWKDEVKPDESGMGWQRVRYDMTAFDPPQVGQAYRMWTPHPRHSDLPDAPLRSIMDIAEELLVLTAGVMGTATTRMTNGMLLVPSEISPNPYGAPEEDDYLGDEDPANNVFLSDMMEHVAAQIEDPSAAASKVPFMLEGGYEYLDKVRWLQTHDPQTDYMERELRKEAVHRLALGMDFPPEFLLGMSDANHWTARQVVYDMWRSYGSPVAERFGDDLSDAYLRPALEEEGYDGWENVVVAFDDSQVVIAPDRTEDALKAHAAGIINEEAARVALGWGEEAKMTGDELDQFLAIKLRQPELLEGAEGLQLPRRGPTAQMNGNSAEDGPPNPNGGREGSRQESRTAAILGASSLALMRCRELAGARIRHKCEDCAKGEPLTLVAAVVGAEGVDEPLKLVRGGTDSLRSWLTEQAFEPAHAASLCQQLEVFAARTLFESRCPELPPGFVASVEKAQEVSFALDS